MRIEMAFGRQGLEIELPEGNEVEVLRIPGVPPLADPSKAVAEAVACPIGAPPLVDLARVGGDAVIVVCDITRPVPNEIMLPPIIEALERAGISRDRITILVATGLHRPSAGDDLVEMLGEDIVREFRVINHRATETAQQVQLGRTASGIEVDIDRVYVEASLRISTGFIEPHLMAGFSGGRKLCGIGCGGERTIRGLHAPRIIEHPNSIEGRLEGNLLHEELTEMAAMVGMDFIVNVTLDEGHRITGVFAGHFDEAFRTGCEFARHSIRRTVEREVDIVVASCGGHPLDLSYYQSAKGFTGAMHICKRGGTVILLSACSRGLGKPEYAELCREVGSMEDFLDRFVQGDAEAQRCALRIDQWQLHNVTRALRKCHCSLVDAGLTPEQRSVLMHPATESFEEALADALARHGPEATIAVIPKGPNVLAQVED